jgi:hypothetical protein
MCASPRKIVGRVNRFLDKWPAITEKRRWRASALQDLSDIVPASCRAKRLGVRARQRRFGPRNTRWPQVEEFWRTPFIFLTQFF